jgi:hypothetical protein
MGTQDISAAVRNRLLDVSDFVEIKGEYGVELY